MTERGPLICPKCGKKVNTYGSPDSPLFNPPNFCGQCAAPLTSRAKALEEYRQAEALDALVSVVVEHGINLVAADLKITPEKAREFFLRWAKRQC